MRGRNYCTHTDSSVDNVASTIADFFSWSWAAPCQEHRWCKHRGDTDLDDTTFYTVFDDEFDGFDGSVLTKSVNAVHGFCRQVRTLRNWSWRASRAYGIRRRGSTSCP
jgi:hypothetical protein